MADLISERKGDFNHVYITTMNISRISKAIAEVRRVQKFEDAESIRNISIDLFLPEMQSQDVSQMAQTATALALRCFTGKIRIHSRGQSSTLVSLLNTEADKMQASARLDFSPKETGPWRLAFSHEIAGTICVDASGWTARINGVFAERIPAASPAICFAVACVIAKIFNNAIFRINQHYDEAWDFCLLRFSTADVIPIAVHENLNIGKIALLGAGAIGSAIGYVLKMSNWHGELEVIDFDYFEAPNLETCILADIQSVNRPLLKGLSLAQNFSSHGIRASHLNREVKEGDSILNESTDAFVCAVDNTPTRRILDRVNSRILINAGLGGTRRDAAWVLWSQHGRKHPSLSSIYAENSDDTADQSAYIPEEFADECSRQHYHGVSLALPFVALNAGSLLAAALYQHATSALVDYSMLQMDLFAKQGRLTLKGR